MICQLNPALAVMDSKIESIEVQPEYSVITMVSKRTHTAKGDWIKIITKAQKVGAVWCCATHLELRS